MTPNLDFKVMIFYASTVVLGDDQVCETAAGRACEHSCTFLGRPLICYQANATLVCVLSHTKSAAIVSVYLSGDSSLQCLWHGGVTLISTLLLTDILSTIGGDIFMGFQMQGRGVVFSASKSHLTANISKTVSRDSQHYMSIRTSNSKIMAD